MMRAFVLRYVRDRRGATAIEYGLICALVFLVAITGITAFGEGMSGMMGRITAAVLAAN